MSTLRDNIYEDKIDDIKPFSFGKQTVDVFDNMAKRSIPGYLQLQETIATFARQFYVPGTVMYDVGCSTGNTVLSIFEKLKSFDKIIAVDNSEAMILEAKEKCLHIPDIEFLVQDVIDIDFKNASLISVAYVLQFIDPSKRYQIIKNMYDSLAKGGVLILAEKLKDPNSEIQSLTDKLYYEYKSKRGYSELEIKQKEKALEGVLIPYTMAQYNDIFEKVGFKKVSIFLKYFNFTGFIAIK